MRANVFKPIPITKSLLDKNGFKRVGYCYGIYEVETDSFSIGVLFSDPYDEDEFVDVFIRFADGRGKEGELRYVHQMQALLHDAGIKWEVKI